MKIKTALDSHIKSDAIITIGTFDGVHIGHQKIIKRLVKIAKKDNLQAIVFTFFPHPRMVLQKDTNIKLINTIDEKSLLLEKFGIDHLVVKEFTKEFSRLTALEFVRDILVNQLQIKCIIIGYDHQFGRNRTANINDLKEFGDIYDFNVKEITAQEIDDVTVSSTKIRTALKQGEIKKANAYLGYYFMLTGVVIKGKGLGKTLGFPTANIYIEESYKLIPKQGVYVVKANYNNTNLYGMMNIGANPTVEKDESQHIEVHFFNFNEDIYDKTLQIEILERLRDEKKFDSVEDLQKQLSVDQKTALNFISEHHA